MVMLCASGAHVLLCFAFPNEKPLHTFSGNALKYAPLRFSNITIFATSSRESRRV